MTEDQEYIIENIQAQITLGMVDTSFIEELMLAIIADEGLEDEIPASWVKEQVRLAYRKHRQAAKTWSKPTDPARLFAAFEDLAKQQIIALHHVGFIQADGEEAVVQVERELRKADKTSKGYCFYTAKDLEDAVFTDYKNLALSFQIINNEEDAAAVALGNRISETLQKHGLTVSWDGTINQKIEIKDINWQKTFQESEVDFMNYDHVLDLILTSSKA